jgi:hypothetical protein
LYAHGGEHAPAAPQKCRALGVHRARVRIAEVRQPNFARVFFGELLEPFAVCAEHVVAEHHHARDAALFVRAQFVDHAVHATLAHARRARGAIQAFVAIRAGERAPARGHDHVVPLQRRDLVVEK